MLYCNGCMGHGGGGHHHGGGGHWGGGGWGGGWGYPGPWSYGPEVFVVEERAACSADYMPVLAVDGRIYDNSCLAERAGTKVVRRLTPKEAHKMTQTGMHGTLGLPVFSFASFLRKLASRPMARIKGTCPEPDCSNPACGLPPCGSFASRQFGYTKMAYPMPAGVHLQGVSDSFGPAILMGGLVAIGALVFAFMPKERGKLRR